MEAWRAGGPGAEQREEAWEPRAGGREGVGEGREEGGHEAGRIRGMVEGWGGEEG